MLARSLAPSIPAEDSKTSRAAQARAMSATVGRSAARKVLWFGFAFGFGFVLGLVFELRSELRFEFTFGFRFRFRFAMRIHRFG